MAILQLHFLHAGKVRIRQESFIESAPDHVDGQIVSRSSAAPVHTANHRSKLSLINDRNPDHRSSPLQTDYCGEENRHPCWRANPPDLRANWRCHRIQHRSFIPKDQLRVVHQGAHHRSFCFIPRLTSSLSLCAFIQTTHFRQQLMIAWQPFSRICRCALTIQFSSAERRSSIVCSSSAPQCKRIWSAWVRVSYPKPGHCAARPPAATIAAGGGVWPARLGPEGQTMCGSALRRVTHPRQCTAPTDSESFVLIARPSFILHSSFA